MNFLVMFLKNMDLSELFMSVMVEYLILECFSIGLFFFFFRYIC